MSDQINAVFNSLLQYNEGWRKIAATMISPIRHTLKSYYGLNMTRDNEYEVEAEVWKASQAGGFSYKEAVRLQDKLAKKFASLNKPKEL